MYIQIVFNYLVKTNQYLEFILSLTVKYELLHHY